jgi:hypothetical protein
MKTKLIALLVVAAPFAAWLGGLEQHIHVGH